MGDDKLPSFIGIIIIHYKDPYKPISIMECHKGFECCSFTHICHEFKPNVGKYSMHDMRILDKPQKVLNSWHCFLAFVTGKVLPRFIECVVGVRSLTLIRSPGHIKSFRR